MKDLDVFGKRLNFGCGFVAGSVIAVYGIADYCGMVLGWWIIAIPAIAIACGMLAARYGDKFWIELLRFLVS